jgi:hypothetical protein
MYVEKGEDYVNANDGGSVASPVGISVPADDVDDEIADRGYIASNEGGDRSQMGVLPVGARSGEAWGQIGEMIGYLGKTAAEICQETGFQVEYTYGMNGSEKLLLHDGGMVLQSCLFSGGIWEAGSRCTGVYIQELYVGLPSSESQMEAVFGSGAHRVAEGNGVEKPYYQFRFDDNVEVRFYAKGNRGFLTKEVLVKTTDAEKMFGQPISEVAKRVIDKRTAAQVEWGQAAEYMAYIGKSLSAITEEFPEMKYRYDGGYYEDVNTGYVFYFDDERNPICSGVLIPASACFSDIPGPAVTRAMLEGKWGAAYKWYIYEGAFYCYLFDDGIVMLIESDEEGRIDKNEGFVEIKTELGAIEAATLAEW